MALACTWYFSAFAHSPAQAAVVVRQEQSTKSFAVSSAMICGSEAGGQNYRRIKGCGSVAAVFFSRCFLCHLSRSFFPNTWCTCRISALRVRKAKEECLNAAVTADGLHLWGDGVDTHLQHLDLQLSWRF